MYPQTSVSSFPGLCQILESCCKRQFPFLTIITQKQVTTNMTGPNKISKCFTSQQNTKAVIKKQNTFFLICFKNFTNLLICCFHQKR